MFNVNNIENMNMEEYITSKGVHVCKKYGAEIICHCPFAECDNDSTDSEGHFYLNPQKGTYNCFKCGAKGNKTTLAQHFGEWERLSWTENTKNKESKQKTKPKKSSFRSNESAAKKFHDNLTEDTRKYLREKRGLTDAIIDSEMIGEGQIYGERRLTIPVKDQSGKIAFFKTRCMPGSESESSAKYKYFSASGDSKKSTLFNGYLLTQSKAEEAVITEGEFDAIIANRHKMPVTVSSTSGAKTFSEEWIPLFRHVKKLYVCLDNDAIGKEGAEKIIEIFSKHRPDITIMQIHYPEDFKDMTEYFVAGYPAEVLLYTCSRHVAGPEPIDISNLPEMSVDELAEVLDTTIKFDKENKCILFLAMLTAYTEEDQLNVYISGPSSSGKTHLMQEVSAYFPEEDKEVIAQASPTAFKHRKTKVDPDTGKEYVDLERKLLLFQDVPSFQLQETLRPLLSHDKKETVYLTTDRGKKSENITKETTIRGFPVSVVCSANSRMDDQESTRAIVLSPEVSDEKIKAGIEMSNIKNSNPEKYKRKMQQHQGRRNLMDRVRYIKQLNINSVIIPDSQKTLDRFYKTAKNKAKPRHQRDIAHFNSLIKAMAMLNAHLRIDSNNNVVSNDNDLENAAILWDNIYRAVELGVPPYVRDFYFNFILPAFNERSDTSKCGVTYGEIQAKYYKLTNTHINADKLRKDIIPVLNDVGAIEKVKDENDKRATLIIPIAEAQKDASDNEEGNLDIPPPPF